MAHETVMKDHRIDDAVQHICLTCEQALTLASIRADNHISTKQKLKSGVTIKKQFH